MTIISNALFSVCWAGADAPDEAAGRAGWGGERGEGGERGGRGGWGGEEGAGRGDWVRQEAAAVLGEIQRAESLTREQRELGSRLLSTTEQLCLRSGEAGRKEVTLHCCRLHTLAITYCRLRVCRPEYQFWSRVCSRRRKDTRRTAPNSRIKTGKDLNDYVKKRMKNVLLQGARGGPGADARGV